MVKAQFQIMQMMIMIISVVFLFVLVGLFLINMQYRNISKEFNELQRKQTIAMIETLINSPEFSFGSGKSFSIDEDKVFVMATNFSEKYRDIWPIASIEILRIYPNDENRIIECPAVNCNYYKIFDGEQKNVQTYSAYVSMCQKTNTIQDSCSLVKFIIGVKNV